jgi:hypothetical protein
VSETGGTHGHNILPLIQDSLIMEGHVLVFTSPRNSVTQLYPRALGSLSVASYFSQGYGGVFHPPQHKINSSEVEVEVILLTMVSRPVCLGVGHPFGAHDQAFIIFGHFRFTNCGAPYLTREGVCNLLVQLLLGLASAVTLESKSRRTRDHILLSRLRLHQSGGSAYPINIPLEQQRK